MPSLWVQTTRYLTSAIPKLLNFKAARFGRAFALHTCVLGFDLAPGYFGL